MVNNHTRRQSAPSAEEATSNANDIGGGADFRDEASRADATEIDYPGVIASISFFPRPCSRLANERQHRHHLHSRISAKDAFLAGLERNTGAFKKGVAASWQTTSKGKAEAENARRGYDDHRIAVRAGLLVRWPWSVFEMYVDHGTLIHACVETAREIIDPGYEFPDCP